MDGEEGKIDQNSQPQGSSMIERIQRISDTESFNRNDDGSFFQPDSAKLRDKTFGDLGNSSGTGGPIKIKLSKKRPTEDSQVRNSIRQS